MINEILLVQDNWYKVWKNAVENLLNSVPLSPLLFGHVFLQTTTDSEFKSYWLHFQNYRGSIFGQRLFFFFKNRVGIFPRLSEIWSYNLLCKQLNPNCWRNIFLDCATLALSPLLYVFRNYFFGNKAFALFYDGVVYDIVWPCNGKYGPINARVTTHVIIN